MKYTLVAAALAAVVSAQSLSEIPSCALPAIDAARQSSTTCTADDFKCICDSVNALTSAATPGVLQACGADVAANQVLPAVSKFCKEVAAGGSSSSSAVDTAKSTSVVESTSSSAAESSAASSAASSSVETTPASITATSSVETSPHTTSTVASNSTETTTPTSVVTAGAAVAGSFGSVGAILLGLLAAF